MAAHAEHQCEAWQILDGGNGRYCGACGKHFYTAGETPPNPLRDLIVEVLTMHIQSARNKRCTCGWRPDYVNYDKRDLFPEYHQHREHLAEVLAEKIEGK